MVLRRADSEWKIEWISKIFEILIMVYSIFRFLSKTCWESSVLAHKAVENWAPLHHNPEGSNPSFWVSVIGFSARRWRVSLGRRWWVSLRPSKGGGFHCAFSENVPRRPAMVVRKVGGTFLVPFFFATTHREFQMKAAYFEFRIRYRVSMCHLWLLLSLTKPSNSKDW